MTCLQNNDFAYQYGDDLGIPALKAHQALKNVTGHWFPFDVEQSATAWAKAKEIRDPEERLAMLRNLIPGDEFPLKAELVGEPTYLESEDLVPRQDVAVTIRLHNISPQPVTILREPSQISMDWPGGSSTLYHGGGVPHGEITAQTFVTLDPAQHRSFNIRLSSPFLLAEPGRRSLGISYQNNGNDLGVKAWIRTLKVGQSDDWKEPRVIKQVEETWPNGNLKASGNTTNGHKTGEWNYFNEKGDRIKTVYHGEGRGTAICNPEHPDNKGAGIRDPKQQEPTP